MKRASQMILCLALLAETVSINAQNRITIDLDDFNSLSVSGRIDVELIPSDSKEMSITSKNGQPDEVNVENKEGELKIKIRPKFNKNDIISVKLPYRSLIRIESLAGAVINSARDIEVEDLELNVATGGKIELSVKAKNITARITQVSDIILYGITETQNITLNTGGNYLAYDLECKDTYIKVSAGSQGKVTASRIIEARANSKGFIGYIGDPESTYTKTSLGGAIASYKTKPEN
jgi:hypothetical protein